MLLPKILFYVWNTTFRYPYDKDEPDELIVTMTLGEWIDEFERQSLN